jgi:hypothetical protein
MRSACDGTVFARRRIAFVVLGVDRDWKSGALLGILADLAIESLQCTHDPHELPLIVVVEPEAAVRRS